MIGLGDMLKKAQQIKANMEKAQEELSRRTVEASAGGGMVKAVVSGSQEIVSLTIDPQVVDPQDPEMLEDLVKAAVNEGLRQSRDLMKAEFAKITGGLPIPNLF